MNQTVPQNFAVQTPPKSKPSRTTVGCLGCGGLFALFVLIGMIGSVLNPDNNKQDKNNNAGDVKKVDRLPAYSIISDDEFGIGKKNREVAVRLEESAAEDELTAIANEIKKKKRKSYEKTNVHFYLPGMKVGSGAWATGNFNPDLEVRIYGEPLEPVVQGEPPANQNQSDLTLEMFNRVQMGMTYEDVDAILGENWAIISKSEIADVLTEIIQWKSLQPLGGSVDVTFQNSKVISKTQFGLK